MKKITGTQIEHMVKSVRNLSKLMAMLDLNIREATYPAIDIRASMINRGIVIERFPPLTFSEAKSFSSRYWRPRN